MKEFCFESNNVFTKKAGDSVILITYRSPMGTNIKEPFYSNCVFNLLESMEKLEEMEIEIDAMSGISGRYQFKYPKIL